MDDKTLLKLVRELNKDLEDFQVDRKVYQSRGDMDELHTVEGKMVAYRHIIDRIIQEL